jgi:transcriptional regulator with XRE-family HTH domain
MPPAKTSPAYAPSVRARRLARGLNEARIEAGITATQAAASLGWSQPKISHIESGRTKPGEGDVRLMLDLYGVTSPGRDSLVVLATEAERRGWWTDYSDVFTGTYVSMEDEAASIREWQPQVIPGLFQTQDYAREVISAGRPESDDNDLRRRIMARMARQTLLRREPESPQYHVLLDEAVIRRPIGGDDVMRAQLRHLLAEARRPNVAIQILPFGAGTHPGLEGPFIVLGFPDPLDPDVVYTEGIYGDVYLESPAQIARCSVVFKRLCELAFDQDRSVALIDATSKE